MDEILDSLWVEKYRPKELSDVVMEEKYRTFFEKCLLIFVAKPTPVTKPIRAHISCTAPISGKERRESQIRPKPLDAPICEYVAMPEGSSSAAPVVSPGPNVFQYSFASLTGSSLAISCPISLPTSTPFSNISAGALKSFSRILFLIF